MIERLLPGEVASYETREELIEVELFPEERASLGRPVEKRRREFVTGRACARRALEKLGFDPVPIANGEKGEPLWPPGVVGSITHCSSYRGCAVARSESVASIGIDAEVHEPLPDGVLESVASATERHRISGAGAGLNLDRVLFCAKEAVYKAWFPLTGKWLGFEDVDMTFELTDREFSARLLVPGPTVGGRELTHFHGRWVTDGPTVLTGVIVPTFDGDSP
jgi:4'-phosphopantetheinyl transferase EntD